jgi:hypothetical protein
MRLFDSKIECFYQKRKEWANLKIRVIIFVYLFVVFFYTFPVNTRRVKHFLSLPHCRFELRQQILTAF